MPRTATPGVVTNPLHKRTQSYRKNNLIQYNLYLVRWPRPSNQRQWKSKGGPNKQQYIHTKWKIHNISTQWSPNQTTISKPKITTYLEQQDLPKSSTKLPQYYKNTNQYWTGKTKQINPLLNIEDTNTGRTQTKRARSTPPDIQNHPANKVTAMFLETIQC